MIDNEEDNTELIYNEYLKFTFKLMNDGTDPLQCAGVMMAHALMLYKTSLPEDEYHKMIELMARSKDNVKTFPKPSVH